MKDEDRCSMSKTGRNLIEHNKRLAVVGGVLILFGGIQDLITSLVKKKAK